MDIISYVRKSLQGEKTSNYPGEFAFQNLHSLLGASFYTSGQVRWHLHLSSNNSEESALIRDLLCFTFFWEVQICRDVIILGM